MAKSKTSKTFYVTVTAEISCIVEVTATDWKSAANKALAIAQEEVDVIFGSSCDSPDTDWNKITEDMVEE
jgi:hypothetical protein